jgi:hypothetical protein
VGTRGGDSLPQRIFDQGIGQSDAVLSVLSDVALAKPWVREEFDVAVVRRISGKTRLIPILLDDDVEVPVAIEHLFHYNVPKQGFEYVVAEVVRDMFNVSRRPPLGSPPPFVGSLPNVRQLEDPIDTAVFAAFIEHFRRHDSPNFEVAEIDLPEPGLFEIRIKVGWRVGPRRGAEALGVSRGGSPVPVPRTRRGTGRCRRGQSPGRC